MNTRLIASVAFCLSATVAVDASEVALVCSNSAKAIQVRATNQTGLAMICRVSCFYGVDSEGKYVEFNDIYVPHDVTSVVVAAASPLEAQKRTEMHCTAASPSAR